MSTKPENDKFADSAKTAAEKYVGAYFDNPALDQAAQKIVQSAMEKPPAQDTPVKPLLAENLRTIQKQELFLGERDEDGNSVIKTFDRFLKKLRRVFVAEFDGHVGDAYKLVTEAVLFNKLQDCGASPLPVTRAQLQKLDRVDAEGQVAVWNHAVAVSGGAIITAGDIAKAAHALGYDDVPMPAPSASSVLNEVRIAWSSFKETAEREFGRDVVTLFAQMDHLLTPKRKKKQEQVVPALVEHAVPDAPGCDNSSAAAAPKPAAPYRPKSSQQAPQPELPAVSQDGARVMVRFASVSQSGDYWRAGVHLQKYKFEDTSAAGLWTLQAASEQEASAVAVTVSDALRSAKPKLTGSGKK